MLTVEAHDCVPDTLQPIFVEAINLLAQKLGITDYNAKITLYSGYSEDPEENGAMAAIDELSPNPRDFLINLRPAGPTKMMVTLAHEMIHVRQYLTGALQITSKTGDYKDKKSKVQHFYGTAIPDSVPYRQLPWEIEAHDKADDLAKWLMEKLVPKLEDLIRSHRKL